MVGSPDDGEKVTESRPVKPVVVTIIGNGDASRLPTGTVAVTDGAHLPNMIATVLSPIGFMLMRGAKAFVVSFTTLMPAAGVTGVIPASDWWHLALKTSSLCVCVGVMAMAFAAAEVLTKLDQKWPSWTA